MRIVVLCVLVLSLVLTAQAGRGRGKAKGGIYALECDTEACPVFEPNLICKDGNTDRGEPNAQVCKLDRRHKRALRRLDSSIQNDALKDYLTKSCRSTSAAYPALYDCNEEFGYFCEPADTANLGVSVAADHPNFTEAFDFHRCVKFDTPVTCTTDADCGTGLAAQAECKIKKSRCNDDNDDDTTTQEKHCLPRRSLKNLLRGSKSVKESVYRYFKASCSNWTDENGIEYPARVTCDSPFTTCGGPQYTVNFPSGPSFNFNICVLTGNTGGVDSNSGGDP